MPCDSAMTTSAEQLAAAITGAMTPVIQQLQAATHAMLQQLLAANQQQQSEQFVTTLKHFSQHTMNQEDEKSAKGGLNERRFRELGTFDGKDEHWTEWALRF